MPEINGEHVDEYVWESVSIERTNLNEEFIRVSADLYYWGNALAKAEAEEAAAKINLKSIAAAKHVEISRIAKLSVRNAEAAVEVSREYQEADNLLLAKSAARGQLRAIVDAVRSKRDMIVSLGAQMRAEMKLEPTINKDPWENRE